MSNRRKRRAVYEPSAWMRGQIARATDESARSFPDLPGTLVMDDSALEKFCGRCESRNRDDLLIGYVMTHTGGRSVELCLALCESCARAEGRV